VALTLLLRGGGVTACREKASKRYLSVIETRGGRVRASISAIISRKAHKERRAALGLSARISNGIEASAQSNLRKKASAL